MTENLKYWNVIKTPPQNALKTIGAGRLKGMNDINPQWRVKAMTETFGVCGIGWKYTIDRQWTETVANGETLAFVNVSIYIRDGAEWSSPIPANGGSKLTAKESGGLYNSDEAYKMALTDALGVAMKMLGMAADVYMGIFDGKNTPQSSEPIRKPQESPKPESTKEHEEAVKAFVAAFNAIPQERKGEAQTITGAMSKASVEDIRKATAHNVKLMEGK